MLLFVTGGLFLRVCSPRSQKEDFRNSAWKTSCIRWPPPFFQFFSEKFSASKDENFSLKWPFLLCIWASWRFYDTRNSPAAGFFQNFQRTSWFWSKNFSKSSAATLKPPPLKLVQTLKPPWNSAWLFEFPLPNVFQSSISGNSKTSNVSMIMYWSETSKKFMPINIFAFSVAYETIVFTIG